MCRRRISAGASTHCVPGRALTMAGFGVRPLGALVFGRIGDLVGRKYTFLVTIVTMGLSTALIGFLPTYASVGIVAPILLVTLRLAQGLALGGGGPLPPCRQQLVENRHPHHQPARRGNNSRFR